MITDDDRLVWRAVNVKTVVMTRWNPPNRQSNNTPWNVSESPLWCFVSFQPVYPLNYSVETSERQTLICSQRFLFCNNWFPLRIQGETRVSVTTQESDKSHSHCLLETSHCCFWVQTSTVLQPQKNSSYFPSAAFWSLNRQMFKFSFSVFTRYYLILKTVPALCVPNTNLKKWQKSEGLFQMNTKPQQSDGGQCFWVVLCCHQVSVSCHYICFLHLSCWKLFSVQKNTELLLFSISI